MIRLGVVGHGARISGVIKSCLRPEYPDIRVVGIVDPNEEGARARLDECDRGSVAFYKSLPEMVQKAKLDALAIGTRCNLHAPYAIAAAKYDLPLYLEKPVAISMRQAQDLEKAFSKSRCPVVVSFPLRVSPLCELARQLIADNAVGKPVHVAAVNYVTYGACYWEMEYRNYRITQGLFLQKATHDFDYLSYLMNERIVRVAATATYQHVFGGKKPPNLVCSKCRDQARCLESPQNRKRNLSGWHTDDHPCVFSAACGTPATGTNEDCSSALLEFKSGAHGIYTQVFFSRRDAATRGATVSGYLGTVSFDWYTNSLQRVRHHEPYTDTIRAAEGLSHFGGDAELARDFIGLIRGNIRKSRTPIETGIQSVYACLAAKESLLNGRFVNVRQVGNIG